ncbi:MAG: universal stress protein [Flavobacteriales bacterium]|nr:universal stress protein [Flavobacteriales bacterium]
MKTILLPTDFSKNAFKAAEYAINAFGSEYEYLILNTYKVPYHNAGTLVSIKDILKKEADQSLDKFKEDLLDKYPNIKVRTKSEYNLLVDEIIRLQEEEEIAFVIMGTQGENQVEKKFLGSNTTKVLRKVISPTIVVPYDYPTNKELKQIVFAADLKDLEQEDLKSLTDFAQEKNLKVKILNVLKENEPVVSMQGAVNGLKLNDFFVGIEHDFYEANSNNVATAITEFAENQTVDLIATVKRKYGLLEGLFHSSVTKDLALHSQIPLLVMPG